MVSPLPIDGYQDLRSYIQSNWTHIAIIDDTDSEVLRWNITDNNNVSWSSGSASNPLEITLTVTGSDVQDNGGTLPVTVIGSTLYKSASAPNPMAGDSHTAATLEAPNDELQITHQTEVPPQ